MKVIILGVIVLASAAHSSIIPLQTTGTLVRIPEHDSSLIQSERHNGAFSYSTIENHAYAPIASPVIQTYATYPWSYYPNIYYPQQIYPHQIYPTYTIVAQPQPPSYGPGVGLPQPGQPPVEVEDPADNTENQEVNQEINNNNTDDDTVAIESA